MSIDYFYKAFKKIRISNKKKIKSTDLNVLLEKRNQLKRKNAPEEIMEEVEGEIAVLCQEANRSKVMENFNEVDGSDGTLAHHGIWKVKQKIFPKIKPKLSVGKKNLAGQLITNPAELNKPSFCSGSCDEIHATKLH